MNTKIFIGFILLLIITETIGRECWQCTACPKPFKNNEAGVTKITVGDDNYCQKYIDPILKTESRGDGGTDCTPVDKIRYCCKGDLCNGTIKTSLSIQLLLTTIGLFFIIRLFY